MNKLLSSVVVAIALVLTACNPSGSSSSRGLGCEFKTTTTSARSAENQNEVTAMYFGSIGIFTSQYIPGFEDASPLVHCRYPEPMTMTHTDWAHNVILYNNYTQSSDVVLKNGETVDVAALSASDGSKAGIADGFPASTFSMDLIEVYINTTGVILNNLDEFWLKPKFYSSNAMIGGTGDNHLVKYPEFADIDQIRASSCIKELNGLSSYNLTNYSVVFARNDWFAEPMQIIFKRANDSHDYTVSWKNRPFVGDEEAKIMSYVKNGPDERDYGVMIIIPYDLAKIALAEDAEGMKNPVITVSFDFTKLLTAESYNNWRDDGDFRDDGAFIFDTDAKGVPFGLKVSVEDRAE